MPALDESLDRQSLEVVRDPWSVRNVVTFLVQSDHMGKSLAVDDRRAFARLSVKINLRVTPVGYEHDIARLPANSDTTISGCTKDISFGGTGFTHQTRIASQYAIITFDAAGGHSVSLLADLRWTNPHGDNALLSGAQFIGVTETPWFLK